MKTFIGFIPAIFGVLLLLLYSSDNLGGGEKGVALVYIWFVFAFIFCAAYFVKPIKKMTLWCRIFSGLLCSALITVCFLYLRF